MKRLLCEITESVRIALAQIRGSKMRSTLTALGVVIGIIAVTLMGTAIQGIDVQFNRSLAALGDDILYVQKWPWHNVDDWWNYANRRPFVPEDAEALNRIVASTSNSLLDVAVPVATRSSTLRAGDSLVGGVIAVGTTAAYGRIMTADFQEGRLFSETEAAGGSPVCVLGADVAAALFPGRSPLGQTVTLKGQSLRVIGVVVRQGSFLGLLSFDNQILIPLNAYRRHFNVRGGALRLQVKVRDKTRLREAEEELIGAMRRVRRQMPGERDNFSINQQEAFKEQLGPVKEGMALAGLFITGLALFVGAIGIMNITFVSVKERTREIGTRKALGARRRTILLQFLIEAVTTCVAGGAVGLSLTYMACAVAQRTMPAMPIAFSWSLAVGALGASVFTGVVSGFLPALGASRLDPVVALRYE